MAPTEVARRQNRTVAACGVAATIVAAANPSAAQARPPDADPIDARLEWVRGQGAGECLDPIELEAKVEAHLDRDAFPARGPTDVTVRGRVDGSAERGFEVHLELFARDSVIGTREIESPAGHCSSLDEPLALVVALMIDVPREQADPPAPTPTAPAPASARPAFRPTPIQLPEELPAPRAPWELGVFGSGTVGFGLLPGMAAGPRVGLWLVPPRVARFEVSGTWWTENEGDLGRASIHVSAHALGIAVCTLDVLLGPTRGRACLGQELGVIRARGSGFDRNGEDARLLALVTLGVGLDVPLYSPLVLRIAARGEVPLVRDRFVATGPLREQIEVHRASAVLAGAELGFGLSFR